MTELRTAATQTERGWVDQDGFLGPLRPGTGGRRDPAGDFPTGPEVGEPLPPVVAPDQHGRLRDVLVETKAFHAAYGNQPH